MEDYFIVMDALTSNTMEKSPGFKQTTPKEGYEPAGQIGFFISEVKRVWGINENVMIIQFQNEEAQHVAHSFKKFMRRHRDFLNLKK